MRSECKDFEKQLIDILDPDQHQDQTAYLSEHTKSCPACMAKWETWKIAESTLRMTPQPHLSEAFETLLHRRLEGNDSVKDLSSAGRHLMRIYWAIASLACFYISFNIRWPGELHFAVWIALAFVSLVMAGMWLAGMRFRRGILDFALRMIG